MEEALRLLPERLARHLELSLLALVVGTLVSVPLGIWVSRRDRLRELVVGAASVIQTIPALALLAAMVPALAALAGLLDSLGAGVRLSSIGFLPAFIALTLYSLLPILRNTVTGLAEVDPALVEAARGVGMTERQQLVRVELPLALPVIVAGLRTAAVWVVGMATLSTPVGATSLGNYIFGGLQTRDHAAVFVGCVAAAGLAIGLDQLIHALERGTRDRRPGLVRGAATALGALALVALVTGLGQSGAFAGLAGADARAPVRIGSKPFTEQYILARALGELVHDATGARVDQLESMGSMLTYEALVAGDLDLYVDYTGTLWANVLGRGEVTDRAAVLGEISRWLAERHGIEVLGPVGFENAYALAMRRSQAEELGVHRVSDLARHAGQLSIGGDFEFFSRPEWAALVDAYGFAFREERSMDPSLMYTAAGQGEVDVIGAYTTDGRIDAFDLVVLEDDRGAIPPYDAIVVARAGLRDERPAVVAAAERLVGAIDAATMRRLNRRVDEGGVSPGAVARELVATLDRPGDPPPPDPG